ncbi:phytanoyl-CoA dioxygenase family protein [bacterium]|nr:MAG: phytanoyl-CoA dioxygenase family protein [bacterium]
MSTETLPNLDSPYTLSPEALAHYREHGWVLLRHVLAPQEIAAYRRVILDATMRFNSETRPLEERDTYGKAFLQVMNLWTVDEAVKPFTLSRRLAGIAAALMEVDRVRLYHDQALFKEPGGGHTPWHQDQFYWPLDTPETVTLWMPMVDVNETMGSMSFADGSQKGGFVPISAEISDASESFFDDHVKEAGYPIRTSGAMQAGDATFHSGWTLHRAPGNSTDRVREVMTVIYYPEGTIVKSPSNDFQAADLQVWLGSKLPGEPADGPLNPLL